MKVTGMATQTLPVDDELYDYMIGVSLRETDELKRLREETYSLPSRELSSAPEQSQLMAFMCKVLNAKNIIEVGIYTGYSTLTMALTLPDDGKLIACDQSDENPSIGMRYWEEAGVADKIDFRSGPAMDTLKQLAADKSLHGQFDFAYLDADKTNNPNYIEICYPLMRTGGVICIDNIFADGFINDEDHQSASLAAMRKMNSDLHHDERFDLILIPIGDGMTYLRKR